MAQAIRDGRCRVCSIGRLTVIYNPNVDISKDTTTLYASDMALHPSGLGIPFAAAVPSEGQEAKWPAESQRV
jgi:hypothetical protein